MSRKLKYDLSSDLFYIDDHNKELNIETFELNL